MDKSCSRFAIVCVCTALLCACAQDSDPPDADPPAPGAAGDVKAGMIEGSILFENPAGPVTSFIASQTVGFPADARVFATHASDSGVSAAGVYAAPSASGASASYALAVPLGAPGNSAFRLVVDMLEFEPNAASPLAWLPIGDATDDEDDEELTGPRYRFGSDIPGASAAHIATLTDGSAEYDISECAALVNVRVRFAGEDDDLDAIDPNLGSIVCSVRAMLEDVSFSGESHPQAHSDLVVTELSVVRNQGMVVPILVRGDGSRIRLEVGCAALTIAPGFPLPPELPDGWTTLGTNVYDLATDFIECDEVVEVDADVPVERTAGVLRGLFDVVGTDESHQRVEITSASAFELTPPTASALDLLDDSDPEDYWEFEGVPAGEHSLRAWAVLDNGAATIETPHTEAQNGLVEVTSGQTTDLRARFVAEPHMVTGEIRILDPVLSEMDFRLFQNAPFTSMNSYLHSHVQARGRNVLSTLPNGASGIGGRARGLLSGSFDETTREATLNYAIPLIGLSPVDGPVDGSSSQPTPWSVDRILLYLRGASPSEPTETLYQRVDIEPGYSIIVDAEPGEEDEVPTMTICVGHVGLELRLAPGIGTLYDPRLRIGNSPLSGSTEIQPPSYSRVTYGHVIGAPNHSAQSAMVGRVEAVLPEGIQYSVQPSLNLISPDGTDSELTLQEMQLPLDGPVTCGSATWDCASIDENGDLHTVGVSIEPEVLCETDTSLTAIITSDLEIRLIQFQYYSESMGGWIPAETICPGSCGTSPIEQIATTLTDGVQHVRVEVEDAFGCRANRVVPVQPYTPVIDCPAEIRVVLEPGESSISSTDSRIQPSLDSVGLAPGCGDTPTVSHDAPATFAIGATTVTFTAEGAEPCATTVLVVPPVQLAYIEGSEVKIHRVIDGLQYAKNFLEPKAIDFDGDGTHLVVVTTVSGRPAALLDPETDTDYAQVLGFPTFQGPFPGYIHMDARTAGPAGFAVSLSQTMRALGVGLGADLPTSGPTLVDFSDDGERLLVASTHQIVGGAGVAMNVFEADTTVFPLTFTELGEITLPGSPIDLTLGPPMPGGYMFSAATTEGLFHYDDQLVQTFAMAMPIYSWKFSKRHSLDAAAVCRQDGTMGLMTAIGLMNAPEPPGLHDIAFDIENRMFAVVRPNDIVIYRWEINAADQVVDFIELETIPANNAKYPVFRPGAH